MRDRADWFENAGEALIVGQDEIGPLFILTVFVGVDQGGSDAPQLFETLYSVDGEHGGSVRHPTWEQAERHHRKSVLEARTNAIEGDA